MFKFSQWKQEKTNQLNQESSVIQTALGPIEYCLEGNNNNPVVAIMHGAPGGFDQGLIEKDNLGTNGFRILTWSRPGYLRTPLSTGKTFKEQAAALNSLIESLKIPTISLIGISAGGVPALFFAQDYPQKLSSLIMEVALSKEYTPSSFQLIVTKLFFNDFGLWIMNYFAKKRPQFMISFFMNVASSLDKKTRKKIIQNIIKDTKQKSYFLKFLQSMSPMCNRKQGLYNDLSQYTHVEGLDITQIKIPTLVIYGKYDTDVKPFYAHYMKENMPCAKLYELKDGFHFFWFSDQFEDMEKEKIAFLKKHST